VHSVIVNTGGFSDEELKKVEERAYEMGVTSHHVVDETKNFYNTCVRFLIYGNVLKNNTYPLSVSAERVSQATAIANYAKEIGAE
jgi:argininosuccinate synthase